MSFAFFFFCQKNPNWSHKQRSWLSPVNRNITRLTLISWSRKTCFVIKKISHIYKIVQNNKRSYVIIWKPSDNIVWVFSKILCLYHFSTYIDLFANRYIFFVLHFFFIKRLIRGLVQNCRTATGKKASDLHLKLQTDRIQLNWLVFEFDLKLIHIKSNSKSIILTFILSCIIRAKIINILLILY
jgi:hypothetical protein